MATPKQINYVEILFNEAGISSLVERKEYLKVRFQKEFLSDLSVKEASQLIEELLENR